MLPGFRDPVVTYRLTGSDRALLRSGLNRLALVMLEAGATEVFPPEDADVIIDNTASGATLAANGLVVIDEVQRLAERATNATRRIEMLVQNIQADTSEAVVSMESTTSEVVSGAEKAEDAGEALKNIESVSKNLSTMIEEISQEAQTQSETATSVAGQMNSIRDVSIQTLEGSNQTAQSMGSLTDLVHKLSDSVADFKLPEDRGTSK